MRHAKDWALEFLNKHVLNTRASGEFERFIMEVQKDAQTDMEFEVFSKAKNDREQEKLIIAEAEKEWSKLAYSKKEKFHFLFANFLFEKLTALKAE